MSDCILTSVDGICQDERGNSFYTWRAACAYLRCSETRLRLAIKGDPWLGRAIKPCRRRVRENCQGAMRDFGRVRRIRLYPLSELDALKASWKQESQSSDAPWPCTEELIERDGWTIGRLKQLRKRVERRPGLRVRGGVTRSVAEWNPKKLEAIRQLEQLDRPPQGFVTRKEARAEFGFAESTIHRWCEFCTFLGRGIVSCQGVFTGTPYDLQADLVEAKRRRPSEFQRTGSEKRRKPKEAWVHPDNGLLCYSTPYIRERFGIREQTLHHYRDRHKKPRVRSRYQARQGPPRRAPAIHCFRVGNWDYWSSKDVEEYVLWKLRHTRRYESIDPKFLTDWEASQALGVTPSAFYHWRDKDKKCPHLGRALYAEKREGVWHNSRSDLEAIAVGLGKTLLPSSTFPVPVAPQERTEPIPSTHSTTSRAIPQKRRGRKKGWRDDRAGERNKQMVKAWKDGAHPTITALGRAFHVSRARARQILDDAGALV